MFSEKHFEAIVAYTVKHSFGPNASFGPLWLFRAVPELQDEEVKQLVAEAIARGLFVAMESGRVAITDEGRRLATRVRIREGDNAAFALEYKSLRTLSLADAVLLHADETYEGRVIWLEDLYIDFAESSSAELKGAIAQLRADGLFAACKPESLRRTAPKDQLIEWASGVTRAGVRRVEELRTYEVDRLFIPRFTSLLKEFGKSEMQSTLENIEIVLRGLPRALRELDAEHRRHGANPFLVENEYDLQDFVRAMFRMLYPESLRSEEATPSLSEAGGRVDFLIDEMGCFIELKVFRSESDWKTKMLPDIASKLERYGRDPRCQILYVLIYDIKQKFRQAASFEENMSNRRTIVEKTFEVRFIVTPQV